MQEDILDKFSTRARRSLVTARIVASELKHKYVGTGHLVLGILKEFGSLGGQILLMYNADFQKILFEVGKIDEVTSSSKKIKLSKKLKKVLKKALFLASNMKGNYVGTQHLLAEIINDNSSCGYLCLEKSGVDLGKVKKHIKAVVKSTSRFPKFLPFQDLPFGHDIGESSFFPGVKRPRKGLLSEFAEDLVLKAGRGLIDPVVGRRQEIDRLMTILMRRTKNNPVLIGEAGVGKTAIVEGLARKIVSGEVPDSLLEKRILALDLASVVSGTAFRGEFEDRVKRIISEVKKDSNIILFIDEIHNVAGVGNALGSMDAANILKPALARGDLRCIGATTLEEYQKYIEKDPALERRFQPIVIREVSLKETKKILSGLKRNYERFHGVKITERAISLISELSNQYITGRFLPDKAVDVLDEAASLVRLERGQVKDIRKIHKTREKLRLIDSKKLQAIKEEDFRKASVLKDRHIALKRKLDVLLNMRQDETPKKKFIGEVTFKEIAKVVSLATNIPVDKISVCDIEEIKGLEKGLKEEIIGQDNAISELSQTILRSRIGINSHDRPQGSFIFLGPTGVGKTELAKVLAKKFFKHKESFIKVDMSEFSEKFTVSRLLGAPAGYVGYEEGGKLTEQVKRNPHSVILFDEIEKAHPEVINILLQVLEDGYLTDAKGRRVDFRNTVIIMTSNIGMDFLRKAQISGFRDKRGRKKLDIKYEEIKEKVLKDLKAKFPSEFLGRVDKIIVFRSLDKKDIKKIVELQLEKLKLRVKKQGLGISLNKDIVGKISNKAFDPAEGARKVRKVIQEEVEDRIAEIISKDNFKKPIKIRVKKGELVLV